MSWWEFRGFWGILQRSRVMFSQCAVSIVNRIELLGYHGISDSDDIQLRQFLRHVECLEIDRAILR